MAYFPTTNKILRAAKEESCIGISPERKYYHDILNKTFTKRNVRPREWQINRDGRIHVPRLALERLQNEAATLAYIREQTSIPVPKVYAAFEDDGAFYLVTQYVEGTGMHELSNASEIAKVRAELETHLRKLQNLRSKKFGGPSGLIVPPYRVLTKLFRDKWNIPDVEEGEQYVFCHGDLSMHNVIVDPETLKIKAIIDWEYAGFYPKGWDFAFYKRKGPSVALEGEADDSEELEKFFLEKNIL